MSRERGETKSFSLTVGAVCLAIIVVAALVAVFRPASPEKNSCENSAQSSVLAALPKPEKSDGVRGEFGIDKNINETTLDDYLRRPDTVYRDMRMLKDPGNYEAIGGDSYLSGYVDGFEVVPFPYLVNVSGLPAEVGDTYTGKTLFTHDEKGNYRANYVESMPILEALFPKDKNIFLMCGGGGYAGMMKDMLVALGWDENRIYNVGGYWNYDGKNNIEVKTIRSGRTVYDFWKVPYHDINFSQLHEQKS